MIELTEHTSSIVPRDLPAYLREAAANALGTSADLVAEDRPLTALGLDSLAAIELQHRLERDLGVGLSAADLLEGISLRGLAGEIAARLAEPTRMAAPAAASRPSEEESGADLPASRGQRGLWAIQQLAPASAAYNIAASARVRSRPGTDVPGLLRRVLEALVRRHPAWRTTFELVGGEPRRRVHSELPPEVLVRGAEGWPEPRVRAEVEAEAYQPFDLERGPLVRLVLWRRADGEHVLLFAVHHAVADFWSLAVVLRELAVLLADPPGDEERAAAVLPAPAFTYSDYVRWQEGYLAGVRGAALEAFWRERLGGELPPLDLATDRPHPPIPSFRGGAVPVGIDAELAAGLRALARSQGATLHAVLLAAFQAALHRHSRQERFAVGTPAAGRMRADLAGVVGYLVNPVVLRADLSGGPGFAELLGRARKEVLAALAHQDYPFPLLAERIQPQRDPSRFPLFQAMLVVLGSHDARERELAAFALGVPGARLGLGGLVLESLPLPERTSQLDVTMRVAELGDGLEGGLAATLQYDAGLFDGATALRLAGHLRELLAAALTEPERPVADLPFLTMAERAQVLREWNDTGTPMPGEWAPPFEPAGACLHELFERQARRTPEALALVAGAERLSYADLDRRAGRIARILRRYGVGPEVRVGVLLPRSADLVAALLAVLRAGGAYVPLDPTYPRERLRFMIADAGAGLVLAEERWLDQLLPGTRTVCLDGEDGEDGEAAEVAERADESRVPPEPRATPGNLAYLLYTSGSTGRPKGVAVEHRSPVARVRWAAGAFSPAERAAVLAATSASFDLSVFEIFVPLATGGAVVLAEDALALPALPAAGEVTLVNTVPSAMAELLRAGGLPEGVRAVNLAGEPLRGALARAIQEARPGCRVRNLYGPTEDTTYSTWAEVDPPGEREPEREPAIGRPLAGTRAYLLDSRLEPVPPGAPGELCLAGVGLARGYLGRPELTAERFVPDPFGAPGARLYRTGDLARHRVDGAIEYLGRIDHQVKVRGFRIELGEMEAALAAHPAVREAAVVAHGDRLVAYVAAAGGVDVDRPELRDFLAARLPAYMLPSTWSFLPELPHTTTGKIDRRALPPPAPLASRAAPGGPSSESSAFRARDPVEELVAGIWSEVLELARPEDIRPDDSFFDLGGHSLRAAQVASRVREVIGVELPLRWLFEAPTVPALARRLREAAGSAVPPLVARPRPASGIPLSFSQQRLWFLWQLAPGSSFYNMPAAILLDGPLDGEALARTFDEIVRRHESLRTRFPAVGGRPVQAIAPPRPHPLPAVDLRGIPDGARRAEAGRLAEEEARRPFDLARGPLLRTLLLRLGPESHLLVVNLHHVVSDGWSIGVLYREFAALYPTLAAGRPSPLPDLRVQYADFSLWQRERLAGEALARELAWWRGRLADLPETDLPADRPRPAVQSFRGASLAADLPASLKAALAALSRRLGGTLFMTLLAGFEALVHRYTGREDLVAGAPVAGREDAALESLVGFFVNTLVLRTDLSGRPGFGAAVERVRETALEAYAHQALPFERLVEELAPERDLSRQPLFGQMLQLLEMPPARLALPGAGGLVMERLEVDTGTTTLDLALDVVASPGGSTEVRAVYAADLFDAATVHRLLGHFLNLLGSAVAEPERPLATLDILEESERHQTVVGWNDWPEALGEPVWPVHDEVAARAAEAPDAIAVVCEGERLSYGELDRRANRLAHRLRARGAGPEEIVAVCLERSAGLALALVAVLKSGGVYLPLDPTQPRERLAVTLADAGAGRVLTSSSLSGLFAGRRVPLVLLEEGALPGREGDPWVALPEEALAYVIYTSGSTGRPKGVGVSHGALAAHVAAVRQAKALAPGEGVLQFAAASFDVALEQLLPALAAGARAVLRPGEVWSPVRLLRRLAEEEVAVADLPTAYWHQLADEVADGTLPPPGASLRLVIAGGEALQAGPLRRWRQGPLAGIRLWNAYGPTEAAITAAAADLTDSGPEGSERVSIGRSLAGRALYVLDPEGFPVQAGVPGELCIGGPLLARGYLGRPELTAERFVPDPFGGALGGRPADLGGAPGARQLDPDGAPGSRQADLGGAPGARLYRTGDLVRWLADGRLEFVGRADRQVKIRGFRIEPGEVEAALAAHPAVREVVVVARDGAPGGGPDRRLVAYVTCDPERAAAELPDVREGSDWEAEQVDQWRAVYDDDAYDELPDPTFNISGWNSSYTRAPIPAAEMREWLDGTVERILGLLPPGGRVLEIGCGTGLVLFRVAPHASRYLGTDFSAVALDHTRAVLARLGGDLPVELRWAAADDLDAVVPAGEERFDAVLLNSVAQYFPSPDYLLRVLAAAVARVAPGGFVFVGDVRSLPLLPAFHASVELYRAAAGTARERLARRVASRVAGDPELVLDPAFFSALGRRLPRHLPCRLPRIAGVEIQLRRGRHRNEMTRFRYDAVLRVAGPEDLPAEAEPAWLDWLDGEAGGLSLAALYRRLAGEAPALLGVRGIPNGRLLTDLAALALLRDPGAPRSAGELRQAVGAGSAVPGGIDPEDLWEMARDLPYEVGVTWSRDAARVDAIFRRRGEAGPRSLLPGLHPPLEVEDLPPAPLANHPVRRRLARLLAPRLRAFAAERLPAPLVPADVVVLEAFPLTVRGKVDLGALPAPERAAPELDEGFLPPRTPEERAVASIWAELLGVAEVGAEDDFFALGGHSLLATQVLSRLRRDLGVELELRQVFEEPTVAGLAAKVREAAAQRAGAPPPVVPVPRVGSPPALPLSFGQRRLWFLHRLDPASVAYNMAGAYRLSGRLDAAVLARALGEVVRRHEVLRSTYAPAPPQGAPTSSLNDTGEMGSSRPTGSAASFAPAAGTLGLAVLLEDSAGEPVQLVHQPVPLVLPLVDLSGLPAEARTAEARRLAIEEADRHFDLIRGPVLRASLVRLARRKHLALVTIHHIACDGWSIGVLLRELAALYAAYLGGRPSPLPEPSLQYGDFAAWQRRWLAGPLLAVQLAAWKERLAGAPPLLELPVDRPRPPVRSARGGRVPVAVPAAVAGRLAALARAGETTLFTVLLAAFQALLGRLTHADDLVVGTPVAGRRQAETEGLIGFFVNTLALRADLAGDPAFADHLARTREAALDALARQDLPFERLVEELRPERNLSHAPVFQVLFALQNAPDGLLELPGLELQALPPEPRAPFDLELDLAEAAGGLAGALGFAVDLFDGATAIRMAGHLASLLAGAAERPEARLSELPLLGEAERRQLCELSRGSDLALPEAATVLDLLAPRAALAPEAVAVAGGGALLTYGELERRAGDLARRLAALGVARGEVVGLRVGRTPDLAVGLLGILRSGAAFLPLDPALPLARAAFLLEDAEVRSVVTAGEAAGETDEGALPAGVWTVRLNGCRHHDVQKTSPRSGNLGSTSSDRSDDRGGTGESGSSHLSQPVAAAGDRVPGPRDLAYVLYTAGTTGRPKGVMVEHGSLLHSLSALLAAFPFAPGERLVSIAPFSFDIFLFELLAPLSSGGWVELVPLSSGLDLDRLASELAAADRFHAVPAVLRQVVERIGGRLDLGVAALRAVFVGGDLVPPGLTAEARGAFPGARLAVLYGPTEGTIVCAGGDAPEAPPVRPLLGRALPGAELELRNRWGNPVPLGVAGEVHLGGAGVARGYLGRPSLTAERFLPGPGGSRLYRTGDLARRLPSGELEFLGRADEQVKVRGVRVEPCEVEARLAEHPGVSRVAVVARGGADGPWLAAFFVPAGEVAPSPAELRAHLRRTLSEAMIPAAFEPLDELPLAPTGKVDRRTLAVRPLAATTPRAGEAPRTPGSPEEEIVAGLWAELLGVGEIDPAEDVFERGAHSLLAMRMASRLRDVLGVELPLSALFEEPTPSGLARRIAEPRRAATDTAEAAPPPIRPAPRDAEPPLSFAQQRLWFLEQMEPGSPLYHIPAALLLRGRLDPGALAGALSGVVRRHEALRTSFPASGGMPHQRIAPPAAFALPVADLAGLPPDRRREEALRLGLAEARRPFDLAAGPLARGLLLRLGASAHGEDLARGDGRIGSPRQEALQSGDSQWRPPGSGTAGAAGDATAPAPEPNPETEHVLVLTVHHIVSDGWSTGILVEEVEALYGALVEGRPSPLPALPVQYADFAAWQRHWLAGEVLEAQLAHWRRSLAGAPAALDLPADRPRPPVRSTRGGEVPVRLPQELAGELARLGRREGATLFMTLLAAFQALLHRHSGQDDLSVGTPVAGRGRAEVERLIGFFANTLVLRADLGGDPPFRRLLARVRAGALDAYAHQDLPFERLVEELAPERDPSRTPLFQVAFALEEQAPRAVALPGLTAVPLPLPADTAKFDLTLSLARGSAGLAGSIEYAADLFDAATMKRLALQLGRLLAAAAADPETTTGDLPLLGEAEQHQVAAEWASGSLAPYPRDRTIHELFAAQVARTPDLPALRASGERLTYAELSRRAERLAGILLASGIEPEEPVGVLLERSAELVVAMLAILQAGAAYLTLDPAYPPARLAFMLRDAGVRTLLADALPEGFEPGPEVRVLEAVIEGGALPADGTVPAGLGALPPGSSARPERATSRVGPDRSQGQRGEPSWPGKPAVVPESLAYVVYTSGSTGQPKGVEVTHRAVVRLALGADYALPEPGERVSQAANVSFDAATYEIWGALLNGAELVVLPAGRASLAELGDYVERHGVTTLWMTTGLFHQMVDGPLHQLAPVRRVLTGGEVTSAAHVRQFLAELPGRRVVHAYGPTENTTFTSCRPFDDADEVPSPMPIGRAIAGTYLRVLDPGGRPVPPGVAGELCTGGDGLARGYRGWPELTAERFIPDGGGGAPGARLYRTGDLARWLPDGEVEFLGRLDGQVKVRGFRVEPGEVEAAAAGHPSVRQAAVVALADPAGGQRLAAYLVPAPGALRDTGEVRAWLRGRLPEAMVPAAVVWLDVLPVTGSGKVDRRALARVAAQPEVREGAASPRSPVEEALAGIWCEVLGIEAAGRDDDFFDLGGHSLLATQVASRAREAFGVELPLADLFAAPRLAELAARIEEERRRGAGLAAPPVEPAPRGAPLPLSFGQEWMWVADQLDPEAAAYNAPLAVHLQGELDAAALASALGEVTRRHEILRTRFLAGAGGPLQLPDPDLALPFAAADLAALPAARREPEAARLAAAEAARPFDLAAGPPARALLLRLEERDYLLVLGIHHLATDGWSAGVLLRETAALYEAALAGVPSPLPELPVQYADFAVWQRRWLAGETLETLLSWWREHLAAAPVLELPVDRPAAPDAARGRLGERLAFRLDPRTAAALSALARGRGTTLFTVLLAAFSTLLARYARQEDLVVGTPVANRTRRELEGLVGYFVNDLALRADLSGDPTLPELLARLHETALGAWAHQDLPFSRLVRELGPAGAGGGARAPFRVWFQLQNTPLPRLSLPGISFLPHELEARAATFDLELLVLESDEGLAGHLVYDRELFRRATAAGLLESLLALVDGIAEDPGRRLFELPLLAPAERHSLLFEEAPAEACPGATPLHGAFAAVAAARPEAIAVTCEGRALTYGALARRAEALAHRLRALGVGPESRVGLAAGRSLDLVVGVLGILAAGGAYVPLDPDYPRERLELLLDDAQVAVLVATEVALGQLPQCRTRALVRLDAGRGPGRGRTGEPPAGSGAAGRGTSGPPAAGSIAIGLGTSDLPITGSGTAGRGTIESQSSGAHAAMPRGPLPEVDPDHLAYVIYTSGSTGRPKGVMVTHRQAARLFEATRGLGFGPEDVWTLFHSYAFDFSVWELWGALAHGGRLAVVPRETSRSPEAFLDLVAREGVTVLNQTPSAFYALVRAEESRGTGLPGPGPGPAAPSSLRRVLFGGEALEPAKLLPWFDRHGDARPALANLYGITETTVHTTFRPLSRADAESPSSSPIGRPLADLRVRLLDPALQPLPAGAVGEIFVGGGGVARGYLGRPELTAERFVPDPFSGEPGARLYRSGDLARRRAGGEIDYLGRADQQLKVRGFRIEPGEIESALVRHPAVAQAAVVARRLSAEDVRLVACVVLRPGAAMPPREELRENLLAALPEPWVPGSFLEVPALPLTPHGKVDRQAIAAIAAAAAAALDVERAAVSEGAEAAGGGAVPVTPLEELLAGTWAELLEVDRVGRDESFFALGGHSLLITRVASRMREALGVAPPMRSFFDRPTVASLAAGTLEELAARLEPARVEELLAEVRALPPGELAVRVAERRASFARRLGLSGQLDSAPSPLPSALGHREEPALRADGSPMEKGISASQEEEPQSSPDLPAGRRNRAEGASGSVAFRTDERASHDTPLGDGGVLAGRDVGLATWIPGSSRTKETKDLGEGAGALERLARRGGEVRIREVLAAMRDGSGGSGQAADEPLRVETVAIPTRDRPEVLERGIASYAEAARAHGRALRFAVLDDSRDPAVQAEYRRRLSGLGRSFGVEVLYAGPQEKSRFAARLAAEGIPPEVVAAALSDPEGTGVPIGANRNAVLLQTIGEGVLSVDDDTLSRGGPPPASLDGVAFRSGTRPSIAFLSGQDPGEIHAFVDRAAALAAVGPGSIYLPGVHEAMLGRDLGAWLAGLDPAAPTALDGSDPRFLQSLQSGGRILITTNGWAGDCGWRSPTFYMLQTGESWRRLARSSDSYRAATASKEIVRFVSRFTVGNGDSFMATLFTGLDNRRLLPPFPPVLWGEDLLFGITLGLAVPGARVGHLPAVATHEPIERRAFWPGEMVRSASGIDHSRLVSALLAGFDPPDPEAALAHPVSSAAGATVAENLRRLGEYLAGLARLAPTAFDDLAQRAVRARAEAFAAELEARLAAWQEAGGPEGGEAWAADVRRYLDLLRRHAPEPEFAVPLDLLYGRGAEEARRLAQRLVGNHARVLAWWPDLVEAARHLKAQGLGLAEEVS